MVCDRSPVHKPGRDSAVMLQTSSVQDTLSNYYYMGRTFLYA